MSPKNHERCSCRSFTVDQKWCESCVSCVHFVVGIYDFVAIACILWVAFMIL